MRLAIVLGLCVIALGACRRLPHETYDGGGELCEFGGKRYREGDSFPDADGCNQCFCEAGGSVACTLALCELDPRLGRGYR